MEHLSELLKILDGALTHDIRKASDYANLLADKLEKDGQTRQAHAVRGALSRRPARSFATAGHRALPIDDTSNIETLDIFSATTEPPQVILNSFVEEQLQDFLSGVNTFDKWHAEGVQVANRLLITGPPGTGKTTLAQLIAHRLQLPLATTRSDSLVSSLLGRTSRNIREIFDFAKAHPCVLFLDEFDALAKMRSDSREVGELQRVVIALLQNIDALPESTIVIAATNHPELLDRAVWRRFAYHIRLGLPHHHDRERLWAALLSNRIELEPAAVDRLTEVSEGMSPSAIKAASNDILRHALLSPGSPPTAALILRRVARVTWDDFSAFQDVTSEMRALRSWQPKVFTVRALADSFGVSTRQVTNALRGAE